MLSFPDFDRDAADLARHLLGKVIRRRYKRTWLSARIIETEAYYRDDKASHSSLGYTEKRKAMFMPAGTIYMYYARGGDSLNLSARGEGNAVLIKAAYPWFDDVSPEKTLKLMQQLNPGTRDMRPITKLCAGQTLLCRALDLHVKDWDTQQFCPDEFYLEDVGESPNRAIRCPRLGIPPGRDEHLLLRFVDPDYAKFATSNPLTKRGWLEGRDYRIEDC